MSVYDDYVIDCINSGKRVSGKKLSLLASESQCSPMPSLYAAAKGMDIPVCEHCNLNPVSFVSISKGFRKYCSSECYNQIQSARNTASNASANVTRKAEVDRSYEDVISRATEVYAQTPAMSIRDIERSFGIPTGRLRRSLVANGLVDRSRQTKSLRGALDSRLGDAYAKLSDVDWVKSRIADGWTSRLFANHLNCSPNLVCERLRSNGVFLSDYSPKSSYETQIASMLARNGVYYVRNDRSMLKGKELDIWIPSAKVAIEINGVYWHQDPDGSRVNRHLAKTEACDVLGIRLMHFTDKEIDTKWDLISSSIMSAVGRNVTVYARKCEVREIGSAELAAFATSNHLQGHINSSVRLGLFHGGELVSVMGFATPRFNSNYQYELTRFCNKVGLNVVGGASKLYSFFLKHYDPTSVLSYCQRRLFTGSVYEKLGMVRVGTTPPNYVWVHRTRPDDVKTRYQSQKHLLVDCPADMTEREYMEQRGYMKIYDCGQITYGYNRV